MNPLARAPAVIDKGFDAAMLRPSTQHHKDTSVFIRAAISAAVLALLMSAPAKSESLSDYFRSASDFRAGTKLVLENSKVAAAATPRKVSIDGKARTAHLKSSKLLGGKDLARNSLKTMKGYRLYETVYEIGGKTYKGYTMLDAVYTLGDDQDGKGEWKPRVGYFSVVYKGRKYDPRNAISVNCGHFRT
jgi:hypothetical protein